MQTYGRSSKDPLTSREWNCRIGFIEKKRSKEGVIKEMYRYDDKEHLDKELPDKELLDKEQLDKELLDKEHLDKELPDKEPLDKEPLDKELLDKIHQTQSDRPRSKGLIAECGKSKLVQEQEISISLFDPNGVNNNNNNKERQKNSHQIVQRFRFYKKRTGESVF